MSDTDLDLQLPAHVQASLERAFGPVTVVRRPPKGMADQSVAVVAVADGTEVFAKWADQGDGHANGSAQLAAEAANLLVLDGRLPYAERLAYDPDGHVLVCRALCGPVLDDSNPAQLEEGARVLQLLEALPRDIGAAPSIRCMRHAIPDDGPLVDEPRQLWRHYQQVQAEPRTVLAHTDPHTDNWLWDHGTLHLVDFSQMTSAPAGFDLCFMVSLAGADTEARARLVADRLGRGRAQELVGAVAYRTMHVKLNSTGPGRTWATPRLERAVELYDALS